MSLFGKLRGVKTEAAVDAARVSLRMMAAWSPIEQLTPRTLSASLNALRAGDLQTYARIWDEARQRDDILAGVEPKRRKAVSRLQYEIVSLDDTPEAKRQKEIAETFFDNLTYVDTMDEDQSGGVGALVRGMLLAVGYGWSVQEIVWQPSPTGLTAELRQVPLSFFERRSGRLRYLATEGAYTGRDLDEGGWLVTACPDLLGVASLVLYLYKHMPLRDWLVYCHRYVVPGLHGKTPARKGSTEWDDLRDALAHFGQDWALLTGSDATVEAIDAGARGTLPYPELVDRCDRRLTALWRGADLSTMSSSNATGASLQGGESELLMVDDVVMIEETIGRRLMPYVLRYTLGADAAPCVEFRLQHASPQIDRDLAIDDKLINWGAPVSIQDLLERYGRPKPAADEELAHPAVPASSAEPWTAETLHTATLHAEPAVSRVARAVPDRDLVHASTSHADPVLVALASDLAPVRARLAAALARPDAELATALADVAADAPALFRLADDAGALPAALARRLAQQFVDGMEGALDDQEA